MGLLGVNIFFVISGFLITTICLKEKIITKSLDLKKFYIRRAIRILPVAYLYLAVLLVSNLVFKLDIAYSNIVAAALYAANFKFFKAPHVDWYTGHFWSLAIEEQFYLLFPVFLKKNTQVFTMLLLFILCFLPLLLFVQLLCPSLNGGLLYAIPHFLIKFQAIAVGCLFSILVFNGYLRFVNAKTRIIAACIVLVFYLQVSDDYSLKVVLQNLLVYVLIGLVVVNNIYGKSDFIYKFLNYKILNTVGILSYSIYIWQQLFTSADARFPVSKIPFNLLFIVIIPCLSYYLFEKRFLALKARFAKIKTG